MEEQRSSKDAYGVAEMHIEEQRSIWMNKEGAKMQEQRRRRNAYGGEKMLEQRRILSCIGVCARLCRLPARMCARMHVMPSLLACFGAGHWILFECLYIC
mgnify:CR=1 FL=1